MFLATKIKYLLWQYEIHCTVEWQHPIVSPEVVSVMEAPVADVFRLPQTDGYHRYFGRSCSNLSSAFTTATRSASFADLSRTSHRRKGRTKRLICWSIFTILVILSLSIKVFCANTIKLWYFHNCPILKAGHHFFISHKRRTLPYEITQISIL